MLEKNIFFDALDDIYSSAFDLSKRGNVSSAGAKSHVGFSGAIPSLEYSSGKSGALVGRDNGGMLSSHLAQAAHISQILSCGLSEISINEQMLEKFPHAILILDDVGRIMRMNEKAARITDGMDISDSTIKITRKTDDRIFQKIMQQAIACRSQDKGEGGKMLSLLRPSGQRPYAVFIVPVPPGELFLIYSEPALLVIIADPDENPDQIISVMRDVYGLSRREAELVARLSEGLTLPNAARGMSIAYETARTMMKRIFRKTGCKNQTELVRVILALPK